MAIVGLGLVLGSASIIHQTGWDYRLFLTPLFLGVALLMPSILVIGSAVLLWPLILVRRLVVGISKLRLKLEGERDSGSSTIVGALILVSLVVTVSMGFLATMEMSGPPADLYASWRGVAPDYEHVEYYEATVEGIYGANVADVTVVTEKGRATFEDVSEGDRLLVPCHGAKSFAAIVIDGRVADERLMHGCTEDSGEDPATIRQPSGDPASCGPTCNPVEADLDADGDGASFSLILCEET